MDKLDRFILKNLANLSLVITFTVIIAVIIIFGLNVGWKINWIPTILFCCLLLCDWIYLIRCWRKMK